MAKTNAEYTTQEFKHYGLALENIIQKATRGLRYGFDMVSSRALCLEDCEEMAARALRADAPIKVDNSRPLHVEAAQEGSEKFYVVVDAHGNFFAKTYSHRDAELIVERC